MTLILDAGALVALERDDRETWVRIKRELTLSRVPLTHGGVVAQVWRGGGGRQANLARALRGVRVVGLDDEVGRAAGALLAAVGTTDAIDAAVVALAIDDDSIVTSDPDDLQVLVAASGRHVDLIPA